MLSLQLPTSNTNSTMSEQDEAISPISNDLESTSIYALLSHSKTNLCRFKSCNQTA